MLDIHSACAVHWISTHLSLVQRNFIINYLCYNECIYVMSRHEIERMTSRIRVGIEEGAALSTSSCSAFGLKGRDVDGRGSLDLNSTKLLTTLLRLLP